MQIVETTVRFAIAVLFDGLWEGALLAVATWAALRALRAVNATTRHWILAAALLASVIVPVITASLSTSLPPSSSVHPVAHQRANLQSVPTMPRASTARVTAAAAVANPMVSQRPGIALPRSVAFSIVALWLAGVLVVVLRLASSLWYLERLKRDALPVPVAYRAGLVRWIAATKGTREVRLCRSAEIAIPIAVGLFDAMILIPEHFLEELSTDDVDRIVLHELAHLRRGDDWINALERIVSAVLFFNPGIAWLVAQLDIEREVACDDWVLQQNEPLTYASCLAKVVESAAWPYRAMSAPGAFMSRRAMSVRIERLLSRHRDVRVRTSLGPAAAVTAALATLGIVAAIVAPSVAYTMPNASPAPVAEGHPAVQAPPAQERTIEHRVVQRVYVTPEPSAHGTVEGSAAKHVMPPSHAPYTVATIVANSISRSISSAVSDSVQRPIVVAANNPDYIDELAGVGYTHLTIDQLTELRAVGVTGEYIRGIQSAGLTHPSVDDLVRLRAMRIDPDFVRSVFQRFGSSTDLETIAGMRAVGVTPQYMTEMANAGYPNLTARELVQLKTLNIDAGFVQRAASHGFRNLTTDQLVRLKVSGIL